MFSLEPHVQELDLNLIAVIRIDLFASECVGCMPSFLRRSHVLPVPQIFRCIL